MLSGNGITKTTATVSQKFGLTNFWILAKRHKREIKSDKKEFLSEKNKIKCVIKKLKNNDIDILNKIKKAGDLLRVCAVGGNANNGTNCGLGYVNTNNVPSNRNVNYGSRLYIQGIRIKRHNNIKQVAALPLGKKQHLSNGVSNLLVFIGKILFVYPISESPNSLKA